ncbi:MAG: homocysteine S-methyltransferase family protein [Fusobacteria bacterium]|nr:homocysteine S-methyltransferase family protein [Fusobacteriota bacterium]
MLFKERLNKGEIILFDGAMGTMLQANGMTGGELPERYNLEKPEIIEKIHLEYLVAGADVITTNTFGANSHKLEESGLKVKEVIEAAVSCARKAIEKNGQEAYVALDIGPVGQLMEPMGTLSFDDVYELVKEQVVAGEKAGCDLVLLETMTDIYELKAAVLAIKENTSLPVLTTMTFEANGRSLTGTDPETMVNILEGLGVDALGMNCSLGPIESKVILEDILKYATFPVMIQPNAGLPVIKEGKTVYSITEDQFVEAAAEFLEAGISILGGCCGTTPSYIGKLKQLVQGKRVVKRVVVFKTKISSPVTSLTIGEDFVIIGERINPTGKKKMKEALLEDNLQYIIEEAITQEKAGAHALDVNVGLPKIDEPAKIVEVIKLIQEISNLPLQIDSADIEALERGCRYYNGKALINSVNGKAESMEAVFPIAKKYGACIIALTLDEGGIPNTAEERYAIAKKIMDTAAGYGIPKENIIIDSLVLTASAQQKEVMETVKTLAMVKEKLGLKTSLGVSNVSFGLPNRPLINKTFLTMAMTMGLDVAIINPMNKDMIEAIDSFRVLANLDRDAVDFVARYGGQTEGEAVVSQKDRSVADYSLQEIIIGGLKDKAAEKTIEILKDKTPLEIVNGDLMPALNIVGDGFEKGKIFLPQLIQSAETVKASFGVLKEAMTKEGRSEVKKGKVILATVKGDIHDIGKNIVKVLMENYGFEVFDLGKDVDPDKIIAVAKEKEVDIIGLSALMTTTVKSMEETILKLRTSGVVVPVMVGGAVLTLEYADMIGADFYGKDAKEAVSIAHKVVGLED